MWKNYEVDESKEYYVALVQNPSGSRKYELCEKGNCPSNSGAAFETEIVPYKLLFRRDFIGISKAIKLKNGKGFYVDAHGVWYTEEETKALDEDDEGDIPWLNGIPPLLAPR